MKYDFKSLKEQIFQDKNIEDFCITNKLSDDDILTAYAKLSMQKENNEICIDCDGKVCSMDPYGLQTKLIFDNYVDMTYFKCPKIEVVEQANIDLMFFPNREQFTKKESFFPKERAVAYKVMKEFLINYQKGQFNRGIFLHGSFGTGKTFLLMKLAQDLSKKDIKVIITYYPDLVRFIKSTIATNELEATINKLKYVDVLILDDIGAEVNTGFIRDEVLGPILQFRLESGLSVFMTSNYNLQQLREHFMESKDEINKVKSDRIIERIKYLMYQIELIDKNYRNNA